jgi:hypothetical protein
MVVNLALWYRQSKRNLMKAFEHHLSVGDSDGGQFSLYLLSLIHRAYLISSDFMRRFISLNQQIFVNNTITIIIFVYMTSQNFDLFLWSTGLLNTNLLKYRWTPEETVKEQLHKIKDCVYLVIWRSSLHKPKSLDFSWINFSLILGGVSGISNLIGVFISICKCLYIIKYCISCKYIKKRLGFLVFNTTFNNILINCGIWGKPPTLCR